MHHPSYIRSKTKAGLDSSCAAIMRPVESKLQKTPPRRRLPEAISRVSLLFRTRLGGYVLLGCPRLPARRNPSLNPKNLNLSSRMRSMLRRVPPPEAYTIINLRTFSRSVRAMEDAFRSQVSPRK